MEDDLGNLPAAIAKNAGDTRALRERVDYLHVAVMRGDPRFCRDEFARPDFDGEAFDREWATKGKRVPSMEEVFG